MSGTVASFPFPATLGTVPGEGSKYVLVTVPPLSPPFTINLLSAFQSGRFTTCQGLIYDNSTSGLGLILTSLESGLVVKIPPFTMGAVPLLCGPAPEFALTAAPGVPIGQIGQTRLYFVNTTVRPFQAPVVSPPLFYSVIQTALVGNVQNTIPIGVPGALIAVSSLDITLAPTGAVAAASVGFVELYEQSTIAPPGGPGYAQIWSGAWAAPVSAALVPFYTRQLLFPAPLVQHTPGNLLFLYATGTVNISVTLTMTYTYLAVS